MPWWSYCWTARVIGHSALLGAPEELELNVVWVAKGQHRVRRVRWLLDPGVWDAQLVEPVDPLHQLPSITDEKLKMIETVACSQPAQNSSERVNCLTSSFAS